MIFENFYNTFQVTDDIGNAHTKTTFKAMDNSFKDCIREFGGKTFNNGLYRVFRGDQIQRATDTMKEVFPKMRDRIICFGFDWLGRNFSIDFSRKKNGKPLILLLEPGAGEAIQIPASIIDFHNDELVNYTNEALSANFFDEWYSQTNVTIKHSQCVGYKVPLFLGGGDIVDNLELIDMDVYINICGQLRNMTKKLPNGMTIKDITM